MAVNFREEFISNQTCIRLSIISFATFVALGTGSSPARSEAQGGSAGSFVGQTEHEKASNEKHRQKNIKALNEYFDAEREHQAEQDRAAAAWT
jgi:hypothetical protein